NGVQAEIDNQGQQHDEGEVAQPHAHLARQGEAGIEASQDEVVVHHHENTAGYQDEEDQPHDVRAGDSNRITEEEILDAEVALAGDDLQQDGAEAHGAGEEDPDDRVVGETRLLADVGDEHTNENTEEDHDGQNPVVELLLLADASRQGEEKPKSDAGEGTVGESVAEERHAVADDKRADRTTDEADEQHGERAPDLEVEVEERVGRKQVVEGHDRPI